MIFMRQFKNITAILFAVLMPAAPLSHAAGDVGRYGSDPDISDIALIYAGNTNRPDWTAEQLRPYVTHKYADGHEDWFFDAFLFLEFSKGSVAFQNGMGLQPALQKDWLALLEQLFAKGYKLDALDNLISQKKVELGNPLLRHKVVIACCAPAKLPSGNWARTSWGVVDGKDLRFVNRGDRITAVKWYIDTLLTMWKDANFKNIDLQGIYWLEEGLFTNGEIMAEVNGYIHSKGLRSYWIPYYTDNEVYWSGWKDTYDFDMCYIQPNYAFLDNNGVAKPYSLLTQTVSAAKSYGMGLELEFETQSTSNALHEVNPALHQHINDYMDVFDSEGVFDSAGVAYYTGTQGLIHMDKSSDPVNHATMDRMARYVAARHKARASSSVVDPSVKPQVWAYAGNGEIFISSDAPDAMCYDIYGRLIHKGDGVFDCLSGVYIISNSNGEAVKLLVR